MTFSEKLVRLRKLKGITQDEFASAVGVSRQAVYKWESGQSYPEVPKLIEMKTIFGISIDDLLDENYEVVLPEKKKKKRTVKAQTAPEALTSSEPLEHKTNSENVIEEQKKEESAVEHMTAIPDTDAKMTNDTNAQADEFVTQEALIDEDKKKGFFKRLFGRK